MRRNAACRPLTPGESALGHEVFGDDIDCSSARILCGRFWPFQKRGLAMAPDGNIYFHPADHVDDFSAMGIRAKAWFIHELTHVWQHQHGVKVILCGMFNRNYSYAPFVHGKPFRAYGVEQQATIVADYFRLKSGYPPRQGEHTLAEYEALLPFERSRRRG
ncbi:MAG: type IV secretion protein Rhs [Gammaproteobacteria bacterium]